MQQRKDRRWISDSILCRSHAESLLLFDYSIHHFYCHSERMLTCKLPAALPEKDKAVQVLWLPAPTGSSFTQEVAWDCWSSTTEVWKPCPICSTMPHSTGLRTLRLELRWFNDSSVYNHILIVITTVPLRSAFSEQHAGKYWVLSSFHPSHSPCFGSLWCYVVPCPYRL